MGGMGTSIFEYIKSSAALAATENPLGMILDTAWSGSKAVGSAIDMVKADNIDDKIKYGGDAAYNAVRAVPVIGNALNLAEILHGDPDEFKGAAKDMIGLGTPKIGGPYDGVPMPPTMVEPNMTPVPAQEQNSTSIDPKEPNKSCQPPLVCE